MLNTHNMLGLNLNYFGSDEYLNNIISMAQDSRSGYCCVANVHMCVLAHDDPEFAARINSAHFVVPDSTILQRARSWRYQVPFTAPLKGADLMKRLCSMSADLKLRIALIGGKDDEALQLLSSKIVQQFPSIDIVYKYSPPFRALSIVEDNAMVDGLRASKAQLAFVGLGCPKQENWMASHTDRLTMMLIGVGAAFDFNSGLVKESPAWVHRAGLEWLYRMSKDPKRLWKRYLGTSPRFLCLLGIELLKVKMKLKS